MTDAGYFRGTSADQDNRFADKEKKLMKQMKFEEVVLNTKMDWSKIKLDVLKPWISDRVAELLGIEDDVVVEFIFNQLEAKDVDPRKMQINLTGFLNGKNARIFMGELWTLLDSAQKSDSGIPQQILDQKKEELKKRGLKVVPMRIAIAVDEDDPRVEIANPVVDEVGLDHATEIDHADHALGTVDRVGDDPPSPPKSNLKRRPRSKRRGRRRLPPLREVQPETEWYYPTPPLMSNLQAKREKIASHDHPEIESEAKATKVPASPRRLIRCKPNAHTVDATAAAPMTIRIGDEIVDLTVGPNVAAAGPGIGPSDHVPRIVNGLDPGIDVQDRDRENVNAEIVKNATVKGNDGNENVKIENGEIKNGRNDDEKKIVNERESVKDKRKGTASGNVSDVNASLPKSVKKNSVGSCKKKKDNVNLNVNPPMNRKVKPRPPHQSLRRTPPRGHPISDRILRSKRNGSPIPLRLEVANRLLTFIAETKENPTKCPIDVKKSGKLRKESQPRVDERDAERSKRRKESESEPTKRKKSKSKKKEITSSSSEGEDDSEDESESSEEERKKRRKEKKHKKHKKSKKHKKHKKRRGGDESSSGEEEEEATEDLERKLREKALQSMKTKRTQQRDEGNSTSSESSD
eukprot:TCALIF_00021-PA protein Name:"Similar to SRRM1 Serine/arginine repetitive matrix protein 1 (Gallus gallus)" AED:0.08 eAED:0.08 QI:515/0.4/0.5/1/1/1/6/93/633